MLLTGGLKKRLPVARILTLAGTPRRGFPPSLSNRPAFFSSASMKFFAGLSYYAPAAGPAVLVPNPAQLDYDPKELLQRFHQDLLAKPKGFGGEIRLPYHVPIEFLWSSITDTSGAVLWRTSGELRATSILLNGTETPADLQRFSMEVAQRQILVPGPIFSDMMKGERPLLTTIHYDLRSIGDCVLATVGPLFATAFFRCFGDGCKFALSRPRSLRTAGDRSAGRTAGRAEIRSGGKS